MSTEIKAENSPRRTFAIISHPDAGKTTLTEKLLLFAGAIQLAGTIKGRKAARHATSDWMALEMERGISVTTSVMQFPYHEFTINLLDTPGHADFTEDTYRTLTAVDSALMVVDAAKGVEPRTIKLMEVCRLRQTPIMTFINKMDREGLEPIELLDDIETILKIKCAPVTWPIGMGRRFKGIYHFIEDVIYLYQPGKNDRIGVVEKILGLDNPLCDEVLGELAGELRDEVALVQGASHRYDHDAYLAGKVTPVFFGSAINNFGVQELLNAFSKDAPGPLSRAAKTRVVLPSEKKFSGFVFKIQANMDPLHRDRIAFLRIVSGQYRKGMKLFQVRLDKTITVNQALTFMAGQREHAESALPGDIIGIHNYGTIQIGDTFTEGEAIEFTGIPNFAPELFRLVRLKDPLKQKALLKGLTQLSEEGAAQVFRVMNSNDLILGAVGLLQFDVVAYRLTHEYNAPCVYDTVNVVMARWIECDQRDVLEKFKIEQVRYLALDGGGHLTYLAPSRANLEIAMEKYPEIRFHTTREHG